jgi:hypothetical protein
MDARGGYLAVGNSEGMLRIYQVSNPLDTLARCVSGKVERDNPDAIGVSKRGELVAIAARYF